MYTNCNDGMIVGGVTDMGVDVGELFVQSLSLGQSSRSKSSQDCHCWQKQNRQTSLK